MAAPPEIPIIDVGPLTESDGSGAHVAARRLVVEQIGRACREVGFFYAANHGVPIDLEREVFTLGREFFQLPVEEKMKITVRNNDILRGYVPIGDELTYRRVDMREALQFNQELADDHPLVIARKPIYGKNQWPLQPEGMKPAVLRWMDEMNNLGIRILEAIAESLDLGSDFFARLFRGDDRSTPFRFFWYPAQPDHADVQGVGQHTDFGLLTILAQDNAGGLQVLSRKTRGAQRLDSSRVGENYDAQSTSDGMWIDATPIPGTYVVNIGDMIEVWTSGVYRATIHRVTHRAATDRLSVPIFMHPPHDTLVEPISVQDGFQPFRFGDYLARKIGKMHPTFRDAYRDA